MISKNGIRAWMYKHLEDYKDDITGEVDLTLMAEAACMELDAYDEDDAVPEVFFELAQEIADEAENFD